MSWFTGVRDKLETFFGHVIDVASPVLEQAAIAAGTAAVQAKMGGASNHDVGQAAIGAIKAHAPELEAKVTIALGALALHSADQGHAAAPPGA